MSRTWKDRPTWVRLRENMERGLIDHDHRHLGEESPGFVWVSRYPDRDLSVAIPKREVQAVAEHRALLEELVASGELDHYTEEEKAGYHYWPERDYTGEAAYVPRVVAFIAHRLRRRPRQNLCTDLEHYDFHTGADTRNELLASCDPSWTWDMGRRWGRGEKNEAAKATVRQALREQRDRANAGTLDEHHSDPLLDLRYGSKIWDWAD